jgi:hypothetical protein
MKLKLAFDRMVNEATEKLLSDAIWDCMQPLKKFLTSNKELKSTFNIEFAILNRRFLELRGEEDENNLSNGERRKLETELTIEFKNLLSNISLKISELPIETFKRPKAKPKGIDYDKWKTLEVIKFKDKTGCVNNNFDKFLDYWESKSPFNEESKDSKGKDGNFVSKKEISRLCWASGILISDIVEIEIEKIIDEEKYKSTTYNKGEVLVIINRSKEELEIKGKECEEDKLLSERISSWWKAKCYPQNEKNSISVENHQPVKILSLFLASSSELSIERDAFTILINEENKKLIKNRIFLSLERWEYFIDAMSKERLQDEYNKVIRDCDIFVSLFYSKVGKYTEEEFDTAFGEFTKNYKPLIYTYFKYVPFPPDALNESDIMTLFNFQKKLKALGHFYTRFESIGDLKYHFSEQLDKVLPSLAQ